MSTPDLYPEAVVLPARDVPLGGPRAMTVRRSLPQRGRTLIGAWCFVDHYGPDDVSLTGGMAVPGHPHTGLQTVSWLFSGEVEHRDTTGAHALVRPGELNLMTAGSGIAHSEYSTPGTTTLHGAQLWVALPEASRFAEPGFEHYVPETGELDGASLRVFLGSLAGQSSPVSTYTDLLGAEITVAPGATVTIEVDPAHEHGFLCDTGTVSMDELSAKPGEILFHPAGVHRLAVRAGTDEPARMLLLGGPPFGEEIVMWWNFVGRSHDEIVMFREDWQRERERERRLRPGSGADRFGAFPEAWADTLPAPPLPHLRLRSRG
jgi:hypothetical protein